MYRHGLIMRSWSAAYARNWINNNTARLRVLRHIRARLPQLVNNTIIMINDLYYNSCGARVVFSATFRISLALTNCYNRRRKRQVDPEPVGFPGPAFTPARRGSIFRQQPSKTVCESNFLSLSFSPQCFCYIALNSIFYHDFSFL